MPWQGCKPSSTRAAPAALPARSPAQRSPAQGPSPPAGFLRLLGLASPSLSDSRLMAEAGVPLAGAFLPPGLPAAAAGVPSMSESRVMVRGRGRGLAPAVHSVQRACQRACRCSVRQVVAYRMLSSRLLPHQHNSMICWLQGGNCTCVCHVTVVAATAQRWDVPRHSGSMTYTPGQSRPRGQRQQRTC